MFNAVIRHSFLPVALLLSLASCSGNGDTQKAQALLGEAREAVDAGRYEEAIALTDSLKRAYPKEIDTRREALHVLSIATERLSLRRLEKADSMLAVLGIKGDSLTKLIKYVNNPVEGYYVAAQTDPSKFSGSTGIQARVSPSGDFYIMSSLPVAKGVRSTSVSVSDGSETASTAEVPFDGERNDRSFGSEVITFLGVECDDFGRFVKENRSVPLTLTFNGTKSFSMPLPPGNAADIATLYEYATTVREAKVAAIEKERLTRALDIARSQAARTFVEKDSVK